MHAQIQRTIVIRLAAAVFVRRIPKASNVINAWPIRTIGNTKKAANCAIAIITERLGRHAIYMRVNVCAAKDLPVDDAINVHVAILIIRHVNDVIAIEPVRCRRMPAKRLAVMPMDSVRVNHLCRGSNVTCALRRHLACRQQTLMDVRDAIALAGRMNVDRVR